jgi:hypothetical protein
MEMAHAEKNNSPPLYISMQDLLPMLRILFPIVRSTTRLPNYALTISKTSQQANFSWKSRLGRDPELRQRKIEKLNQRYTLRRFDELEEPTDASSIPGPADSSAETHVVSQSVSASVQKVSDEISRILGPRQLTRDLFDNMRVGTIPLHQFATFTVFSEYEAVVVARDKGNIDMLFKSLRTQLSTCSATILGRERVEVRLRELTGKEIDGRRTAIYSVIDSALKALKRLELKTTEKGPDVRRIFSNAEVQMKGIRDEAMMILDELGES